MKVNVRLYGDLRDLASDLDEVSGSVGVITLNEKGLSSISDVLNYLDLEEDEISHIFLNGEYSSINRDISNDDRLALFSKDMALLYKWYFSEKE